MEQSRRTKNDRLVARQVVAIEWQEMARIVALQKKTNKEDNEKAVRQYEPNHEGRCVAMRPLKFLTCLNIFSAIAVLSMPSLSTQAADEEGATKDARVRRIFKKYPEADTNSDGVLSNKELRVFVRKMKQDRARIADKQPPRAVNAEGVPATYTNVSYGQHKRNLFDIWLAKSEKPTPLVIYIHGGGFKGGDKSKIYKSKEIPQFLKAGISFATINYRYRTTDPRGVRASLSDSKRALQFIRSKAKQWNIDKTRIGAYGGSAGSGTATWLAFHDDMAEPNNPDPVLRESTRLAVVGALATQATYDVLKWPELLGYTPDPEKYQKSLQEAAEFYGLKSVEELTNPKGKAIRADLDMLGLMSKDDPPLYVSNGMKGGPPEDRGHINHHPLHAAALKKRAEEIGLEAEVHAKLIGIEPPHAEGLVNFFLRHLGVKPAR